MSTNSIMESENSQSFQNLSTAYICDNKEVWRKNGKHTLSSLRSEQNTVNMEDLAP